MTEIPESAKKPQDHKKKKQPMMATAYVPNDPELGEEYGRLQQELDLLRLRMLDTTDVDKDIRDRFDILQPAVQNMANEIRDGALVFKFRSIGRRAFENLIDAHAPTDKSKAGLKKNGQPEDALRWDPDSFIPALVEASCFEWPEGIELKLIWDSPDWNDSELGELGTKALIANQGMRVVPMGNV